MKKKKIFLLAILILLIPFSFIMYKTKKDINNILESKNYSYLPTEAKEYLKGVYEKTGDVILTEKNKKENIPYLNPEFIEYLTLSEEKKTDYGEIPTSTIVDYSVREETENINIPSQYDERDKYITPVRDQGDLGICWTFATAGVAESYLLKNNSNINIDNPVLISERQIDYATSRNGINDYKNEYVSFVNRSLGDGGNFYISTIAMANGISLIDYNSFKEYDDRDLKKMELSEILNYKESKYEVNSTINVPRNQLRESTSILTEDEKNTRTSYLNLVKKNIMEKGSAYVSTYMNSSCQYTDVNLNDLVIDVYNCSVSGGHAMQIIGWNDELEYSYCADTNAHKSDISNCKNIVKGKGLWILKNSWGNELQYPYLTYDSLYTGIYFINEMTSADNKIWDNNYVLGEENENVKEKIYYLKNTQIINEEKIDKIKFITETPDTIYNVKIVNSDGTTEIFSQKNELPGLMTIDITKEITINKDTKIFISSTGSYIDKISIFTSNLDKIPSIDLSKYDNIEISDQQIRLYSETKNIESGTKLIYKMYDSENKEITDKANFLNNVVAENNVNTLVKFKDDLKTGTYKIEVIYNSNVVTSINIKIIKMEGLGTEANPYIITNSTQLSQIRNDLNAYYELGNDIDLTEDTREGGKLSLQSKVCPQGFGWEAINGFTGTLDGKGHTIKGLYQNNYLECNIDKERWREWNYNGNGMFGTASGNVTIKNLVLENFEINCSGRNNQDCSILLSEYYPNNATNNDKNEYTATFENITLRSSNIKNNSGRTMYGGGLFGTLYSIYGNINISNIYLDFEQETKYLSKNAYLASQIYGKRIDVNNIQLKGNIDGKYSDGSGDSVLIYKVYDFSDVEEQQNINNILSTVTGKNTRGILIGYKGSSIINGVNALNIEDKNLCGDNCTNATNINIFNKDTEIYKLTDKNNYSTWENFDKNWVMKTIDGIPRFPVLKFVDFEYTKIDDIYIKQELNNHKKIYDYITPNIDSAKRIIYKSNNEDIVTIDEFGTIIPQSTGTTTIHVESYYDGYIKDVPISIEYKPHYTIHFDSNATEDYYKEIQGTMESIEVEIGKKITLPANKFTQEYYEFKEWNTKPDGTGISYSDLSEIPAMNDKEEITLYVIWWGKERIVNFNANGGLVTPDKKVVRVRENYGELPIPIRTGYAFANWSGCSIYIDAFTPLVCYELKADWINDAYTIIYDANGGTVKNEYIKINDINLVSDKLATTYAKNNKDKIIYKDLYEKSGYMFKEWNTKADGTGLSYKIDQTINLSNVKNDTLRLYAIWEEKEITVTFNANSGTGTMTNQTLQYNVSNKLNKNLFTRVGYTFNGWNTKIDGTGDTYTDMQSISIKEDLTLYAQWKINEYEVTFNANSGTGTMSKQIMQYNISTKLNKNLFTKEGYTFNGWNTKIDGTGEKYTDEQAISIKENLTLYATWKQNGPEYEFKKYTIDENNKYIDLIDINTTVEDFKKNIELNTGFTVDVDYKTVNGKNLLYTGGKTKIYKNGVLYIEYTNIIRGDVNGNATIDIIDYIRIMKDIMDDTKLSGVYIKAADVNQNNTVDIIDYIRIMKMIMEEN